jgi:lipoprotein-releasing system ATP-binding protein
MIQISNLKVRYSAARELAFPTWELAPGAQSLILGRSGSGKTTLLHVLAGLRRPSQGEVVVAGTDLARLRPDEVDAFRGRHLGLVFQQPHLLPSLTVADNLRAAQYFAGLPTNRSRLQTVLAELNLTDRQHQRPHQLSQGEQQRAAIARAMLNQPQVILADEPTSALDDDNCEAVINLLLQQAAQYGASLLVATHDQRLKDRIPAHLQLAKLG